jgi:outer membrane protein OmpA-like peptidoglycan-associated protein
VPVIDRETRRRSLPVRYRRRENSGDSRDPACLRAREHELRKETPVSHPPAPDAPASTRSRCRPSHTPTPLVLLGLALLAVVPAQAQTAPADAKGCQDPAMFPDRIPGYAISRCDAANASHVFTWPGGSRSVLGRKTEVIYRAADAAQRAEPRYVAANYANALRKLPGAKLLLDPARSTLGDRVVASVPVEGREAWVWVGSDSAVVGGRWETYKVIVVASDEAVQVVTARALLDALSKDGFATLYINFETGRWDLPAAARPTIDEIAGLMRREGGLKLSVEGHTDNVGQPAANRALSENRARAVREAIEAAGIPAARLRSAGYGSERPIADNRTEEGRSRNRRVELVKF